MKVVHFSTYDNTGGAAISAYRLHRSLLSFGIDSIFAVQNKQIDDTSILKVHQTQHPAGSNFDIRAIIGIKQYLIHQQKSSYKKLFSHPGPGFRVDNLEVVEEADIIHLHWVTDFISPAMINRLVETGKPVFWTFHDQRPFTGGCHCIGNCANYNLGCNPCPVILSDQGLIQLLCKETTQLINNKVIAVTPSMWLNKIVRNIPSLTPRNIHCVHNAVDSTHFKLTAQDKARNTLGLSGKGIILAFGGGRLDDPVKGFPHIIKALKLCLQKDSFRQMCRNRNLTFITFGHNSDALETLDIPFHHFGYVSSEKKLSTIYAAADYFLLPSIDDNLPNTMLESICCGTPVLAYRTGGIPEFVIENQTGLLIEKGDYKGLASKIIEIVQGQDCSPFPRNAFEERARLLTFKNQAKQYAGLYGNYLDAPDNSACRKKKACRLQPVDLSYKLDPDIKKYIQKVLAQKEWGDDFSNTLFLKSIINFEAADIHKIKTQTKEFILHLIVGTAECTNALFGRLESKQLSKTAYNIIELLEDGLIEDLKKFDHFFKLGLFFTRANRFDKALMIYEKGLSQDFSQARLSQLHFNQGLTLSKLGCVERAVQSHEHAVKASPKNPLYHFHLGIAYKRTNQYGNALQALDKALTLAPQNHIYSIHKSIILKESGHPQSALEVIDEALSKNPVQGDLHLHRGVILRSLKRYTDAIKALLEADNFGADKDAVSKFTDLTQKDLGSGSPLQQ